MTETTCVLCERRLRVPFDDTGTAWLCSACSAHPVLLQHWKEGRVRLAANMAAEKAL